MTRAVGGAVQEVQGLLGVGQRDDQRVIAPLTVVADVHPVLALTGCRCDRSIGIKDRLLEERRLLLLPDLQARFIDRLHQRQNLIFPLEAPAKVPGRGGVRDPLRADRVQIGFVVAEQFQMIQTCPAGQPVVRDVHHVIALVIRQVNLEKMQMFVDGIDQSGLQSHLVDNANAAASQSTNAIGNFIMDIAGREHRIKSRPAIAFGKPLSDSSLAASRSLLCSIAHSKRLLANKVEGNSSPLYTR